MNRHQSKVMIEQLAAMDGGGFVAYYPEFGKYTIYGLGDSVDEAIDELKKCRDFVFDFWKKSGIPIPAPFDDTKAIAA